MRIQKRQKLKENRIKIHFFIKYVINSCTYLAGAVLSTTGAEVTQAGQAPAAIGLHGEGETGLGEGGHGANRLVHTLEGCYPRLSHLKGISPRSREEDTERVREAKAQRPRD